MPRLHPEMFTFRSRRSLMGIKWNFIIDAIISKLFMLLHLYYPDKTCCFIVCFFRRFRNNAHANMYNKRLFVQQSCIVSRSIKLFWFITSMVYKSNVNVCAVSRNFNLVINTNPHNEDKIIKLIPGFIARCVA